MKNRDYVILCLGFLAIAFGYVFSSFDKHILSFLNGFGYAAVIVVLVKGLLLLFRKRPQSNS
ncbi:MAG: hypothetical protein AAFN93_12095 [Bacteroidota bacterium]